MVKSSELNIPDLDVVGHRSLRINSMGSIKITFARISGSKFAPKLVKFINKKLYKFGLGAAINRYDTSLTFFSSKNDKKLYSNYTNHDTFYNFGSGAFHHPRWQNFDYPGNSDFYKAIQGKVGEDFTAIDLCQDNLKLDIADNSASLIYCAHTLEHLTEEKTHIFLKECVRILKPGGIMRIAVPTTQESFNFAKILFDQDAVPLKTKQKVILLAASSVLWNSNTLPDNEIIEIAIESKFSAEKFHKLCAKRGVSIDFNPEGPERHVTFWGQDKLKIASRKAGFSAYMPFYRGQSLAEPFKNIEVFDTTEPHLSHYGEFVKES
jgi:SAM-dependent methyltransferase